VKVGGRKPGKETEGWRLDKERGEVKEGCWEDGPSDRERDEERDTPEIEKDREGALRETGCEKCGLKAGWGDLRR
jgi:hypothetical protein